MSPKRYYKCFTRCKHGFYYCWHGWRNWHRLCSCNCRAAKELNILLLVLLHYHFYMEPIKDEKSSARIKELRKHVDTIIVIPNQNLLRLQVNKQLLKIFCTLKPCLTSRCTGITDLMVRPGLINLDFADVEHVMSSMGKAMMGTGE